MRLWAKRESQIEKVIGAAVGMYGDLQGIAGAAFQEIDGLEAPLLENTDEVPRDVTEGASEAQTLI